MTVELPSQYYERFDPDKNYEEHLFIAGKPLQSAEFNEVQKNHLSRLRGVADALFKDGDLIRDAGVVVDSVTGDVTCESGAIYIAGAVRGVQPDTFIIPVVGEVTIGIRLLESVVTSLEDPELLDPATGTRAYNESGAARLKVEAVWGWDGDEVDGAFFPVYQVIDGILSPKDAPPNLDAVTQALARYDRDSAGGTYIVSGLKVTRLPDVGANQYFSMSDGRARVFGYSVEFQTSRRIIHSAPPDLKTITNEPKTSTTSSAQRVNLARKPVKEITAVSITAQKTVNLTHGVFDGAQDPLPDTSVLSIVSVTQGATTYVATTSYLLTDGKVDWTPAGPEPSPGSTYTVTYQYITLATPTDVDDSGYTVTGAISGTLILTTYKQMLPRIDRLCISSLGEWVWLVGVSAEFNPQPPSVPLDLLAIASVYQTWNANTRVVSDGVRVVPMPVLAAIDNRIDLAMQLIAQQRLESNIHTRESGTKKGLFTDPFIDDSQRDAGIAQTAAIVNGLLMLPISANAGFVSSDISGPVTCAYTNSIALEQTARTGEMKINPYMSFGSVPASVTIIPSVDRWTEPDTVWVSPATHRFVINRYKRGIIEINSGLIDDKIDSRNILLSTNKLPIENLRQITIAFVIDGFGGGEILGRVYFDGIDVTPSGLVANGSGHLAGSFVIPANVPSGDKEVIFVGSGGTVGSAIFSGQGFVERQVWQQQTTITDTTWQSPPCPASIRKSPPPTNIAKKAPGVTNYLPLCPFGKKNTGTYAPCIEETSKTPIDPLAQTFMLGSSIHCTGIQLWFVTKPTTQTSIQIQETTVGFPNNTIVASTTLTPDQINIGGVTTNVMFDRPVQLKGDIEYSIVVMCNDSSGSLAIAEMGKFDSNTQQWVTNQPYTVGVLLSSSNAVTWTAHQDRDLAFRVLRATYSETTKTVNLGSVAVTNATDLILMAFAEIPSSNTHVEYTLTLPDTTVLTVSDGQPLELSTAITGNVSISAHLIGDNTLSPVLWPDTQLVSGVISTTGPYISRAVPAGLDSIVKVIFEAIVPSGATVVASYKGIDIGDTTWTTIPVTETNNVDDGFVEFILYLSNVDEDAVHIKLGLSGTAAARPYVRDLRVIIT